MYTFFDIDFLYQGHICFLKLETLSNENLFSFKHKYEDLKTSNLIFNGDAVLWV